MMILSTRKEEETEPFRRDKYLNTNFINQINQLTKILW